MTNFDLVSKLLEAAREIEQASGRVPDGVRMRRQTLDYLNLAFDNQLVKMDKHFNLTARFRGIPIVIDQTVKFGVVRFTYDVPIIDK